MSSTGLLTCAACGSEEPAGAAFCGNCGAALAGATTETTTADAAATGVLVCPSCGSDEPEGAEFCGSCGTRFGPAPPEAEQPPDEPGASPEAEPPPPPPPATPTARPAWWRSRPALVAGAALLAAAAAVTIVLGTGVVGGGSKSLLQSAFVSQVNARALGPLGLALQTAAGDAGSSDNRSSDGDEIVRTATAASAYLRGLDGLSGEQRSEVRLLLELLGASRQYGAAFGAFDPDDTDSQAALDEAWTSVRSTGERVRGQLPADLLVPSDAAFVSSAAVAPPPPPPPAASQPNAALYVQQVDGLLIRSHPVVLALRSFIPRASSDGISRPAAVSAARAYLAQRRLELTRAQALRVPPAFASSQSLLVQALQKSVEDDQELVEWTVARRDGSGDAQTAFARANQLGAEATVLKKQFLRVYGAARQQATGQSPASLPTIF